MTDNIKDILTKLKLSNKTGRYENHFYIIDLTDSNEYSRVYSILDEEAINMEDPSFGTNESQNTVKITTYFELDFDEITYNLFLIANFEEDKYYLKIGKK